MRLEYLDSNLFIRADLKPTHIPTAAATSSLLRLRPHAPAMLEHVIHKALSKDPERRETFLRAMVRGGGIACLILGYVGILLVQRRSQSDYKPAFLNWWIFRKFHELLLNLLFA
jgi:hypothetical protein